MAPYPSLELKNATYKCMGRTVWCQDKILEIEIES